MSKKRISDALVENCLLEIKNERIKRLEAKMISKLEMQCERIQALEQQMEQISERYSDLLETGKQENTE